jgi:hypothetical protein
MNKLCIVGTHPATRENAPFDAPNVDIWVFNEAPQQAWCKRWDACFQLHREPVYTSPHNMANADHWQWLQQDHGITKTIWMQDKDERVPCAKRYPMGNIMLSVPGAHLGWFASTPAYALALGLYLGYEEIDLYGVELTSNTEYSYQLNNWQFWVGVAFGMGIKVGIKSGQMHFAERMYGYEGETQIEEEYFIARVKLLEDAHAPAFRNVKYIKDKVSEIILERKYDKLPDAVIEFQKASIECGTLAGALSEAKFYASRDDPITRQQFERRSAQAQKDGEDIRAAMYTAGGKSEYVFNVWRQLGNAEALRQLRTFIAEEMGHAYNTGVKLGISHENLTNMNEFDQRLTAAGGVRALKQAEGGDLDHQ